MLQLKLLSPSQLVFDQQASKIEVPGVLGYLCVGSKHTPFLSELRPGIIRVYDQSYKVSHSYYVSGGYFQIEQVNATILADIVESKEEIDQTRALSSQKRAKERLAQTSNSDINIKRALHSLVRAEARISLKES